MENENLARSHGKVIEFWIFTNLSRFSFEKNMLIGYTLDTVESVSYFTWYMCGGEGSSTALTLAGYGYGYGYILAV